ncbi:MAG: elongation factor G [Candidatus Adiutrix sp.]|jgi:elongation factor G|nr:elongation factor G [Candidatus Adiutrix sp.]
MATDRKGTVVRNIGIIAHIDAGKTTLTERILYYTGRTHKIGEVHDGEATMDFMPEEQARGITIMSAVTTCDWKNARINIIDTPGPVDFTIEVERSLRVLDGAVGVFCAVGGVQPQSETVWRQADRYRVPKLVFVNKSDRVGADFDRTMTQLRDKLGAKPLILTRPFGQEEKFGGVLDILREKLYVWEDDAQGADMEERELPESARAEVAEARVALLETLAESDDGIMEDYLEGRDIPEATLREAIRRATIALEIVPVFCGAALRNKGVQPLLDGIVDYLPAPNDYPPLTAVTPEGETITIELREKAPLAALVFKIQMMEQGRKMNFIRVYSGKIAEGDDVFNPRTGQKDKISRILRIHASKRDRIPEAKAGDLVGLIGLRAAVTGDTLCSPERPLLLESIEAAEPVISIALEPENSGDIDKLAEILGKLAEEDPTFKVRTDEETGQTIISGMGELHLEVLNQRLAREFSLNVRAGRPQVVYRETVTRPASAEGLFERELAGAAHKITAKVAVRPLPRGEGYCGANRLKAEEAQALPEPLLEAALSTLDDGANSGPVMGYPLLDMEANLESLTIGEGEDNAALVRMAVSQALREALQQAGPSLMEPFMRLEITTPDEFMGEIIGDMSSRLGRVEDIAAHSGFKVIIAVAPMSELFGYSTAIRSQTQGRGAFSMQFSHYDIVERKS